MARRAQSDGHYHTYAVLVNGGYVIHSHIDVEAPSAEQAVALLKRTIGTDGDGPEDDKLACEMLGLIFGAAQQAEWVDPTSLDVYDTDPEWYDPDPSIAQWGLEEQGIDPPTDEDDTDE